MKKSVERASLKITTEAKSKLVLLANRNGKTELDYASKAIFYLYKSGIDVYSDSLPSVPDLIKNLDKRMVGFLKKREQDFFIPMEKSFRESIHLHKKVLDSLETLDVINYSETQKKLITPKADLPPLKIPKYDVIEEENTEDKKEEYIPKEKVPFTHEERESLLDQVSQLEKDSETYKKELVYLLERIKKGGSLISSKFEIHITNRELEQIKFLAGVPQNT